jgi:hypothetical protein
MLRLAFCVMISYLLVILINNLRKRWLGAIRQLLPPR